MPDRISLIFTQAPGDLMAIIHNEITVNASTDKLWGILADLELLDRCDPTVKKSTLVSAEKTGMDAKRKVGSKKVRRRK